MKGLICVTAVFFVLCAGCITALLTANSRAGNLADKEDAIPHVHITNGSSWEGFWVATPLNMRREQYGLLLDSLKKDFRGNNLYCRIEIANRNVATLERGSVKLYLNPAHTQAQLLGMLLEVRRFDNLSELAEDKYIMGYSNSLLGLEKVNDTLEYIVEQESKDCKIVLGRYGDVSEGWTSSAIKVRAEPGGYAEYIPLPIVMLGVNDDIERNRQKFQEFLANH